MILTFVGSGSFEDAGPFQIVAMEKKTQTYVMHESRFRKRESLAHKTGKRVAAGYYSSAPHVQFPLFLFLQQHVASLESLPDRHSRNQYNNTLHSMQKAQIPIIFYKYLCFYLL